MARRSSLSGKTWLLAALLWPGTVLAGQQPAAQMNMADHRGIVEGRVTDAMGGPAQTQDFYRLFMVPGMAHCYFGPGANSFGALGQQQPPIRDALHDIQTALETWVEKGVAPDKLIATKYTDDAENAAPPRLRTARRLPDEAGGAHDSREAVPLGVDFPMVPIKRHHSRWLEPSRIGL